MRKVSLTLVLAAMLATSSVFALESGSTDPKTDLSTQIGKLLEKNSFVIKEADLTAEVLFTLNRDHELVVISVQTEDAVLDSFVKGRLNYQKVQVSSFKEGKMFKVPVRVKG
jgi:hypothetical protein